MQFLWDVICLFNVGSSSLSSSEFAELLTFFRSGAKTCPLYHHMVWVLGLQSSTLNSSALEVTFWSLFSHSSNLIIDLVPVLNKIILIP